MTTTTGSQTDKVLRHYLRLSLWIIVAMTLLTLTVMSIRYDYGLVSGLIVTVLFSLGSSIAYGYAWQYMARISQAAVTRFYLTAPAVRMVLAGIVMAAWFVIVREPAAIKSFALLFVAFYIILLVFDCIFFARQEKRNKNPRQ